MLQYETVLVRLMPVVFLSWACGSKTESDTISSETDSSSLCMYDTATTSGGKGDPTDGLCSDHLYADECCCFDFLGENVCGRKNLCSRMEFFCKDDEAPCALENIVIDCPDAVDCALLSFADGGPGSIQWRILLPLGQDGTQIHILGDGTAYIREYYSYDVSCYDKPVVRKKLRSADYFLDCSQKTDPLQRFECVRNAFLGDPLETCTEGFDCSPF